jgi:hypothetical protein
MDHQDKALRNLICKRTECDEIWSFCYAKDKNVDAFRGAGISPAIFLISTHCKNAGETPAPQQVAPGRFSTSRPAPDARP